MTWLFDHNASKTLLILVHSEPFALIIALNVS